MFSRACVEGESFGIRDGKIWVDKGCRAQFRVKKTVGGNMDHGK